MLFTSAFPKIIPQSAYSSVESSTSASAVLGRPFVYYLGATNAPGGIQVTGLPAGL